MQRSVFLRAAGALGAAAAVPGFAAAQTKAAVTVFAAASLREAFDAASPAFTAKTGYPLRFSFGGSDTLATQLLQGAPADVFVSANEKQMERVAALANAPRTLAHNRLVVVAAAPSPVRALADLAKPGTKLVLADARVPVGAYARAAFAKLAERREYGTPFAHGVTANVVSEETDVKAVVTKVALGEADAGVAYATDVTPQVAAKLRVLAFPAGTAPEAAYPIATVKAAPNAAGAEAFLTFITSPEGAAFLRARGFAA